MNFEKIDLNEFLSKTEQELLKDKQLDFINVIKEYFNEMSIPSKKVYDEVFFIFNNEIQSGVIREVTTDLKVNGAEILKRESFVIFKEDKIFNYPKDIQKIADTEEELMKEISKIS